jgi:hypothetical protein
MLQLPTHAGTQWPQPPTATHALQGRGHDTQIRRTDRLVPMPGTAPGSVNNIIITPLPQLSWQVPVQLPAPPAPSSLLTPQPRV